MCIYYVGGVLVERVKPVKRNDTIFVGDDCYEINGRSYPRVTRILDIIAKPEFYRWYAKHGMKKCREYRDDRAAFGTRIHSEIRHDLDGSPVNLEDLELKQVFKKYRLWKSMHVVKPVCLECSIWSDNLDCAGTCDFVGMFDGRMMLLDWKTSMKVYDTYPLQVAAYLLMYENVYRCELFGAGVVCFNSKGVFEKFFSREECMVLVDVFVHARELYRWKYGK